MPNSQVVPFTLVEPRLTPCLACLTPNAEGDNRTPSPGDHLLGVGLFARELFALISRATPAPLPMRWRAIDLETLAQTDHSAVTRPGCPVCSVASGPVADDVPLAVRYEASVALPPKEYADLKSHQVHYKASNLVLQREARVWPASRKFPLPEPAYELLGVRWTSTSAGGLSAEMTADRLSLLLVLAAGLWPGEGERHKVGRWTASGGNIGSVAAYVIVRDGGFLKRMVRRAGGGLSWLSDRGVVPVR